MTWLSPGYNYRKQLTITNNTGSDLDHYAFAYTFDHEALVDAGKSRSDALDIVFVDSGENIVVPHYIESGADTTTCKIWFKLSDIEDTKSKIYYMYYGNPLAKDTQNPKSLFHFFEDFDNISAVSELATTNGGDWFITDGGTYSVSGGILRINAGAMITNAAVTFTDGYVLEASMIYYNTTANPSGTLSVISAFDGGFWDSSTNANSRGGVLVQREGSTTTVSTTAANGAAASWNLDDESASFVKANDTPFELGIRITSSSAVVLHNGSAVETYNSVTWSQEPSRIIIGLYTGGTSDIHDTGYDWIRLRRYSSSEPALVAGSEEVRQNSLIEWGLRITKPGVDISEAELEDLVLDTTQNRLKIALQGSGIQYIGPGSLGDCDQIDLSSRASFSVYHGLGYEPMVWFFVRDDRDNRWHMAPVFYEYWKSENPSNRSTGLVAGYDTWFTKEGDDVREDINRIKFWIGRLNPGLYNGDNDVEAVIKYKYFIFIDPKRDAWYE